MTVSLHWHRAVTADEDHDNVEVEFDAIGNPGGAAWAYVVSEGGGWTWGILNSLLWVEYLARGRATTKDDAVAAIERWVAAAGSPSPTTRDHQ